MNREIISFKKLQLVYLSTSLLSTYCVMTNTHLVGCCNAVGVMCLIDFCFVKKRDMMLHHLLVVFLVHYTNTHLHNPYSNQIITVILSTEMSTIFLTLNNLLDVDSIFKQINKAAFLSTFLYYRLYNYPYQLMLDPNVRASYCIYSNNVLEHWEISGSIYVLFMVNVYWTFLIADKVVGEMYKKLR